MSLLEDIVDLLRCVLEYFGVPPNMLVPVWDNQLCGQYRSIVRMIGTNLPLNPYPRLHFQIPLQVHKRRGHLDIAMDSPAIPSFADVLWVSEDVEDQCTKFRNAVPLRRSQVPQVFVTPPVETVACSMSCSSSTQLGGRMLGQQTNPEALKKISALEEELLKLRAQIAMIVTAPSGTIPGNKALVSPCRSTLPPPVQTSTPRVALPPPPPPPPPPPFSESPTPSALETIKQRRAASRGQSMRSELSVGKASTGLPSMLDVLKDLNQVKLRTVERSPGGTPVRKRRSKGAVSASDPAALIAEALRKKFAHRQKDDSFDKENRSSELSPFGSPEAPFIPNHTRRSQGRIHL